MQKIQTIEELKQYIKTYPDFPAKGVLFRDINPLLKYYLIDTLTLMKNAINEETWKSIDAIAGIESRGFILAAGLATLTQKGLIPIRKKGKLPGKIESVEYELEYGTDELEMNPGSGRLLLVDDVIATGGTLRAACELCEKTNHAGYF